MTLGERIRERRQALGISRPKLAERTGIPYSTLAGIENGDQQGSTELHRIARVLQCTVDYLVSGREAQGGDVHQGWLTDMGKPV
ncbi:MAG: helix-turn-helix domain-containing protein, partial [Allorhizobium sp.]